MTTSDFLNPLKIVTFNVHGWYDSAFSGNIPRVVNLLHNLQPDLVAFQEVQKNNITIHGFFKMIAIYSQSGS
jgi:endonuclease/exonuclease/phosphatase family metal-dependent hydrolase